MAAGNTYEAIATQTLGSTAATVTFNSIPSTYTDLVLVISAIATTSVGGDIVIQFNSDTGSNYSGTYLWGNGTSAGSTRGSNATYSLIDYYAEMDTSVANRIVSIQNYSNTTTFKTFLSRANNAGRGTDAIVGMWRSTAAITSLLLDVTSTNDFAAGSTFSLYGIKAA
jgi:hypothetical protein